MQLYGEQERGGGGGGRRTKNDEVRHQDLLRPGSLGGLRLLPRSPPLLPQHPSNTRGTFVGAITQASGRPVGKIRGRPARQWMEPVGGRMSVKVHCLQRWRATLEPSGAGGRQRKGRAGREDNSRGGGSRRFSRGKEGKRRRDLEGGGGGSRFTWGRVLWRGCKRASIVNITK